MLEIRITSDSLTPHLKRVAKDAKSMRTVRRAAGVEAAKGLREHFSSKRSRFWESIRDRVGNPELKADGAVVVPIAAPELVHKVTGGPIEPRRGRALTIPATAAAKKTGSPGMMDRKNFLTFIPIPGRPKLIGALVDTGKPPPRKPKKAKKPKRARHARRPRKTTSKPFPIENVWYWLVRKVDQKPDPKALPPKRRMQARVARAAMRALEYLGAAGPR